MKRRDAFEVIVGGVTGEIDRPESLVAGRYRDGELVIVGRTVPLTDRQSRELRAVLRPADVDHPWPDEISSGWHTDARTALTKVQPSIVVEVAADAARQAGVWRHPLRYVRFRAVLRPEDLPTLPDGDG